MRPLYLDFAPDKQVLTIDNEYLFGKSLLVAPVTQKGATSQSVYLPAGTAWYDFWTGETTEGGKSVERATPLEIVPLYVKAGAILPWGPRVQYAAEKKWDHLEVRIYPGANGTFTLYEDAGDSYDYEKGAFSEITFRWNDKARTLAIDSRKGRFPGMLAGRTFNLVVVKGPNGAGADGAATITKTLGYNGKAVTVKL
ncbi:DUF5110 domain-containing protein [Paraflavisolibacter sp. H34]|uniref:DUF5110 domain-containing protein n=1 Tax=Huijunlia imazamoxiresistens TaxID=3127457 RepID=UPI00301671FA